MRFYTPITDTNLFYILNDTGNEYTNLKDCAGTNPGLPTAGTNPGRRYISPCPKSLLVKKKLI